MGEGAGRSELASGRGSAVPSHISLVEPLRAEWPSCSPIFAADWRCTKPVIRRQAASCSGAYIPAQPGGIRPSGLTQTISVMTTAAPPTALPPRFTRGNADGGPSAGADMVIADAIP